MIAHENESVSPCAFRLSGFVVVCGAVVWHVLLLGLLKRACRFLAMIRLPLLNDESRSLFSNCPFAAHCWPTHLVQYARVFDTACSFELACEHDFSSFEMEWLACVVVVCVVDASVGGPPPSASALPHLSFSSPQLLSHARSHSLSLGLVHAHSHHSFSFSHSPSSPVPTGRQLSSGADDLAAYHTQYQAPPNFDMFGQVQLCVAVIEQVASGQKVSTTAALEALARMKPALHELDAQADGGQAERDGVLARVTAALARFVDAQALARGTYACRGLVSALIVHVNASGALPTY